MNATGGVSRRLYEMHVGELNRNEPVPFPCPFPSNLHLIGQFHVRSLAASPY